MILNGTNGNSTLSGAYFESITKGNAPGIPLHKKELGNYYEKNTNKYYSLTRIRPNAKNNIPKDASERAKMFEGKYCLTKALEPDEAYLDKDTSTLTIFEKKYQAVEGSVDEKLQTCAFKIKQYQKIANDLGIKNVNFIYILSNFFKSAYYTDMLEYIKSIPHCDYYFVD